MAEGLTGCSDDCFSFLCVSLCFSILSPTMGRLALCQEWEALATPPLYGVDWFRVGKCLLSCLQDEIQIPKLLACACVRTHSVVYLEVIILLLWWQFAMFL